MSTEGHRPDGEKHSGEKDSGEKDSGEKHRSTRLTSVRGGRAFLFLGVGLVIAVVAVFLVAGREGSSRPRSSRPGTTSVARRSPEAEELARLLDKGDHIDLQAEYRRSDPATGIAATIRLWKRSPASREDTETTQAGQVTTRTLVVTPTGAAECNKAGDSPWDCRRRSDLSPTAGASSLAAAAAQLARLPVAARDDQVGDQKVRCFSIGGNGAAWDLCFSQEGIPVRLLVGTTRVDLVTLDRSQPSTSVFEPPGPIT